MTDLIDLLPFAEIIECMEMGLRVILVPGGIQADHDAAVANDIGCGDDLYPVPYLMSAKLIWLLRYFFIPARGGINKDRILRIRWKYKIGWAFKSRILCFGRVIQ